MSVRLHAEGRRLSVLCLSAVVAILAFSSVIPIPAMASVPGEKPNTGGKPSVAGAVPYETAIGCAAIDTLVAKVFGGEGASDDDRRMSDLFDAVTLLWIAYAARERVQDKVLADYLAASRHLMDEAAKAEGEDAANALIAKDFAQCAQLAQTLFTSAKSIPASPPGLPETGEINP